MKEFEIDIYSPSQMAEDDVDDKKVDNIIGVVAMDVLDNGTLRVACKSDATYFFAPGVWGAVYAVRS